MEANASFLKIWSGIPIHEHTIKESLGFLNDSEIIDRKYGDFSIFKELSETNKQHIQDINFHQFIQNCGIVFGQSDSTTKIAAHMLLERVSQKYSGELKRFKVLKARE